MMPATPDPDGLRYARYWEPVLATPSRRALARVDRAVTVFLDVGAGTGGLALAAADRWVDAQIIALDASAGMLSVGRQRVTVERPREVERFEWIPADAAAMPLADGSVDVAASSFVLQLVDDRPALLREILRVLRPGGEVALVTWLAEALTVAADDDFAQLVVEMGLDGRRGDFRPSRTTDYGTADELADELAAAGYDAIDVQADELDHAWTPQAYLEFKEQYDERDLFESLSPATRSRLQASLRARLGELPGSAFSLRGPLLSATARRPHLG